MLNLSYSGFPSALQLQLSGDLRYFVSLTFTFTVAPCRMINLVNLEISRGRCPTTTGLSRLTVFLIANRVVHMGRRNSIPANSKSPFQL